MTERIVMTCTRVETTERMKELENASCSTCIYFVTKGQALAKNPTGECRRNPPTASVLDDVVVSGWPDTKGNRWCGEYASPLTFTSFEAGTGDDEDRTA